MELEKMDLNGFLRYWYAYYLVATTRDNRYRQDSVFCEVMETLVQATLPPKPTFAAQYPNRTRFFDGAKVLLLDRNKLPKNEVSRRSMEHFWTTFLPTKHFYELSSMFPTSQDFRDWKRGGERFSADLLADVHSATSWGRSLTREDFMFKGVVLTALEPKRLLVHIGKGEVLEGMFAEGTSQANSETVFDMEARNTYLQRILFSFEAPIEPDYWLGADVTALIDADSYAPIQQGPKQSARFRAPYSDRLFVAAVNALTNQAGIYCLSLFRFPPVEFRTPIMKRWSELAAHWAKTAALPAGSLDGAYANQTQTLIMEALPRFAANYPFSRFGPLMSWLSVQINNANSVQIFTNVDSSESDIERTWRFVRSNSHAQELSYCARAFGFSTYDNLSAGQLSPGDYAASYAFWSFAKAARYRQRAPEKIDFLVSSQRLPLGEQPLSRQSEEAFQLFPWGSLLKTVLDRMGECDPDWLYTLLLDLRVYTVNRLEPFCAGLMVKRTQGIHSSLAKKEWLDRAIQSAEEFVALGLLEGLQEAVSRRAAFVDRQEINAMSLLVETIAANRGALLKFLVARKLERVRRISPLRQ